MGGSDVLSSSQCPPGTRKAPDDARGVVGGFPLGYLDSMTEDPGWVPPKM